MNDDVVGNQLRQLRLLEDRLDQPDVRREVRDALGNASNQVVKRAAELIVDANDRDAIESLVKAYWRLKRNPLKKDPGCLGKTAVIKALAHLEFADIDLFRDGIAFEQIEPQYGGEVDAAAELRGLCAIGLTHFAPTAEVLNRCAVLLVDPWPAARYGAVQAIGVLGVLEGAPLLRLKLLVGDDEADVMGECCSSLLKIEKTDTYDFLQPFLLDGDADICVQTALAIGESQLPGAFERLRTAWGRRPELAARESILLCIGLLRSTESQSFLLSLIHPRDLRTASDAVKALRLHGATEDLRQRVEEAVQQVDSEPLLRVFREEWNGQ
ncbi:hypothetical protein AB1L30_21740 [Bremerella sp. JC817]|uniref:HEAT repeat domain-containing protein n=1 Tax=Bremerella sp. JC817 TaxID=3231756 RepID=UPI003459BA03